MKGLKVKEEPISLTTKTSDAILFIRTPESKPQTINSLSHGIDASWQIKATKYRAIPISSANKSGGVPPWVSLIMKHFTHVSFCHH